MKKYLIFLITVSMCAMSANLASETSQTRSLEELGLRTNTYYSIGVQTPALSSGYLTYTNERSPSGYYSQLATKDLDKYTAGREWRGNALWRFYKSEVPNYYSIGIYRIGNEGRDPNVYLTYSDKGTNGGNGSYLQVADSHLNNYAPGGQWRDSALWRISLSEVGGYFTLTPKSLPNGYLSTTGEESKGGVYTQVLHKQNLDKCVRGGEWRDSVLWKFWPVENVVAETTITRLPNIPTPNRRIPWSEGGCGGGGLGPIFGGQGHLDVQWQNGGGQVDVLVQSGRPPQVNVQFEQHWRI